MYRTSQLIKYHLDIQCPECYKQNPSRKLHIFKTKKGLNHHLTRSHTISEFDSEEIKYLIVVYNVGSGSFIEFCFDRGYLY